MAAMLAKNTACTSSLHCQFIKCTTSGAIIKQTIPMTVRFKSFRMSKLGPVPDYQYLMKSPVPTYHFQKSLPRLPIPELEKTCTRYLRAQQPLLDSDSYLKTKKCVEDFLKNDGIECQRILKKEDKKNKHTSYISKPWFDMYLSDRKPLPINYNPFLVFVNHPNSAYNDQLIKATNLVISSLRFYRSLHEELLSPEVYHMNPAKSDNTFFRTFTRMLPKSLSWYGAYLLKAFPLDMSQYPYLFGTTRIPELNKDHIKHVDDSKHILVMKGGHFYVFDVIDKDGNLLMGDEILRNMQKLVIKTTEVAEFPVGILTTEDRDVWAAARAHLESLGNSEVLELIDTSLFNLVLDNEELEEDPVRTVRCFLHADGANRWFDKSFSLIVTRDGAAGVNFEHSWGDGVAVLRYFNEVHEDATLRTIVRPDTMSRGEVTVRKLEFHLDDKMKTLISDAKQKYAETCNALEVRVVDYQEFGRQLCKPLSISPDAMMQLAFQVAYDQLTGRQATTYESCSTSAFKHGRTETVRPCTLETTRFCKEIRQSDSFTKDHLQNLIVECSKVHSKLIKEAVMGEGFDRHLFALKLKAEAEGMKSEVFKDPAYAAINHNILSTSTLASDNLFLGAFGPVVPDGLGIGYSMWQNRLGSIVTNYKHGADGSGFVDALRLSLDKIHKILRD